MKFSIAVATIAFALGTGAALGAAQASPDTRGLPPVRTASGPFGS